MKFLWLRATVISGTSAQEQYVKLCVCVWGGEQVIRAGSRRFVVVGKLNPLRLKLTLGKFDASK